MPSGRQVGGISFAILGRSSLASVAAEGEGEGGTSPPAGPPSPSALNRACATRACTWRKSTLARASSARAALSASPSWTMTP